MMNERQRKEKNVSQTLQELIIQLPSMDDFILENLEQHLGTVMRDSRKNRRKAPERAKTADLKLEKMQSAQNVLARMEQEARELRKPISEKRQGSSCPSKCPSKSTSRKNTDVLDTRQDKAANILRNIQASLNKMAWSNYDKIVDQIVTSINELSVHGLLSNHSDTILTMITNQVIHSEAYGKMWASLTDIFPKLLVAEKKVLDKYMDYYDNDHTFIVVSNPRTCLERSTKKRQHSALTSFLLHAMKHSCGSMTRVEMAAKLGLLLARVNDLVQRNECASDIFDDLVDDMLIFTREGWEVLYREEVWPACIQVIERLTAHWELQRNLNQKVKMKTMFQLRDMLKDIIDQGRYYTFG